MKSSDSRTNSKYKSPYGCRTNSHCFICYPVPALNTTWQFISLNFAHPFGKKFIFHVTTTTTTTTFRRRLGWCHRYFNISRTIPYLVKGWRRLLDENLQSLQFSWCSVQLQHLQLHLLDYFPKSTIKSHSTLAFHFQSFQILISRTSASSAKKLWRRWAKPVLPILVSIFLRAWWAN